MKWNSHHLLYCPHLHVSSQETTILVCLFGLSLLLVSMTFDGFILRLRLCVFNAFHHGWPVGCCFSLEAKSNCGQHQSPRWNKWRLCWQLCWLLRGIILLDNRISVQKKSIQRKNIDVLFLKIPCTIHKSWPPHHSIQNHYVQTIIETITMTVHWNLDRGTNTDLTIREKLY